MDKEENLKTENKPSEEENKNSDLDSNSMSSEESENNDKKSSEQSLEEKITELEDKLARTFAEMENQRRRFEKERE